MDITKQFMTKDEAMRHITSQSVVIESAIEAFMEILEFSPQQKAHFNKLLDEKIPQKLKQALDKQNKTSPQSS